MQITTIPHQLQVQERLPQTALLLQVTSQQSVQTRNKANSNQMKDTKATATTLPKDVKVADQTKESTRQTTILQQEPPMSQLCG